MNRFKIIFVGPEGAGKSTAIKMIAERYSDEKRMSEKCDPSTEMRSAVMHLKDGAKVQLYCASGRERIDYMWEILSNKRVGLVFMMDNTRKDPIKDLRQFSRTYADFIGTTNIAVGVAKMDINDKPILEHYHQYLDRLSLKVPVFEVDPRRKIDMVSLVSALIYSSNAGVRVS